MEKANYWIDTAIPAFTNTGIDPVHAGALMAHAEQLGYMCPYVVRFRQSLCSKMANSKVADDETTKVFLDLFEVGFTMGILAGMGAQIKETQETFKGANIKERIKMILYGEI